MNYRIWNKTGLLYLNVLQVSCSWVITVQSVCCKQEMVYFYRKGSLCICACVCMWVYAHQSPGVPVLLYPWAWPRLWLTDSSLEWIVAESSHTKGTFLQTNGHMKSYSHCQIHIWQNAYKVTHTYIILILIQAHGLSQSQAQSRVCIDTQQTHIHTHQKSPPEERELQILPNYT